MAGLIGQPDLAPPIRTYRAYFSRPKTDPFGGNYAAVLAPYRVDPLNAAAAPTPTSVAQQIYDTLFFTLKTVVVKQKAEEVGKQAPEKLRALGNKKQEDIRINLRLSLKESRSQ